MPEEQFFESLDLDPIGLFLGGHQLKILPRAGARFYGAERIEKTMNAMPSLSGR
jgi:hypothetical protein